MMTASSRDKKWKIQTFFLAFIIVAKCIPLPETEPVSAREREDGS